MRLLVCGGRGFNNREFLFERLDHYVLDPNDPIEVLIHGASSGADTLAAEWGRERGIEIIAVPADWRKYGRAAGPMRNRQMLELLPDVVVAFSGGKGTRDMLRLASAAGIAIIDLGQHGYE